MTVLNQEQNRAAYEKYLPAAQALAPEEVESYRLDIDLAIINIKSAMAIVAEHRGEIATHLPMIDVAALDELPSLARAVKMSALLAENSVSSAISAREMIAEGWALRKTLMPIVAGFAVTGVIPQQVYDNIARGQGPRDMAEDCVALSDVFVTYAAAVAGKHPVPAATIARAADVGAWLLDNLRTKTARQGARDVGEEELIRDRMATLLTRRYSDLRLVAYCFYRDEFGEQVPPLMSRRVIRKSEPETESDTAPESESAAPEA